MTFLAAAATAHVSTADKLRSIPADFWWKAALGVGLVIAVVFALRKIAKTNKVLLTVGVALFSTIVGFNWIYERNEPTWATPAVQWLAGFFPTKGKLAGKSN